MALASGTPGLAILDDVFPSEYSAFRFAEFSAYLNEFSGARVYSDGTALRFVGEKRSLDELLRAYRQRHRRLGDRVVALRQDAQLSGDFAYTIFVSNMSRFLHALERRSIPFAFTLYPGGGLGLGRPECDAKLRRIFGSPQFRAVIVTQRNVRDYLVNWGFCPPEKIEFIYGVVTSGGQNPVYADEKPCFGRNKDTFDVCFAAHKYTRDGIDKCFDVFVEMGRLLARLSDAFRFHVVGGFKPEDVADDIRHRTIFHGVQSQHSFGALFRKMDLILSPTPAYGWQAGVFDGFPTGSCVEAGLHGVPVFSTDPHNLNILFEDGKDIVLVSREPKAIAETIERYFRAPELLIDLSRATAPSFRRAFGYDAQIGKRIDFIRSLVDANAANAPLSTRGHQHWGAHPLG